MRNDTRQRAQRTRLVMVRMLASAAILSLAACGSTTKEGAEQERDATPWPTVQDVTDMQSKSSQSTSADDATDLFTSRDLEQAADADDAKPLTLASGQDIEISEAGTYVLSGDATDASVIIDAPDDAKIQLVLDGVNIANSGSPAIYLRNADKLFVTTKDGTTNTLQVSGDFVADGETNVDAVIFSKDDITLNGLGTLVIRSTGNGVTSKDDLKVTGGRYEIEAAGHGLEANNSVSVSDGTLAIVAQKDGIHSGDDDDDTVGSIYVAGGTFDLQAGSDGMRATTLLEIDAGNVTISAPEGLEATYVQVKGGTIDIAATDDGINATTKSASMGTPTIEMTGGDVTIRMGQGDTDALDTNGNLIISGGSLDITAQFAFDFDGTSSFTGGTVTVNGEKISEITSSMMGGGMMDGRMRQKGMGMREVPGQVGDSIAG